MATNIQPIVDSLLTGLVDNSDTVNLTRILADGFTPSVNIDLIVQAAALTTNRDEVLQVLINYGIE